MSAEPGTTPRVPCYEIDFKEVLWAASVCIECPFPAPCQMFCSQGVNIPKIIYRSALALAQEPRVQKSIAGSERPVEPDRPLVSGH